MHSHALPQPGLTWGLYPEKRIPGKDRAWANRMNAWFTQLTRPGLRRYTRIAHRSLVIEQGLSSLSLTDFDAAVRSLKQQLVRDGFSEDTLAQAFALTGETDAASAAAALTDHCPGWIVVKLGSRGLLATGPTGEQLTIDAPAVMAIDTTGAGDSLAAGLLASLADGDDVASALATGVRVASTVVGRDSHRRYPTRQELLSL